MRDVSADLGRYFGEVDGDFLSMVGEVVLLAALLEARVLDLLWALEELPQHRRAGCMASELVKRCRESPKCIASTSLQAQLDPFLAAVTDTQRLRNEIVHGVWRRPLMDDAFGWRPVPPRQRDEPSTYTRGFQRSRAELEALPVELVRLIDEVPALLQAAVGTQIADVGN